MREPLAPIDHQRQQRAEAFDAVDHLAGHRLVAIVLGEGDEELRLVAVGGVDEVLREIISGRSRRPAYRDGEVVGHELGTVFGAQIILQALHRLGIGIGPVVELEAPARAVHAADEEVVIDILVGMQHRHDADMEEAIDARARHRHSAATSRCARRSSARSATSAAMQAMGGSTKMKCRMPSNRIALMAMA